MVVLAVGLVVVAVSCGGPSPPAYLGHTEIGPAPFVVVDVADPPAELEPLFSEAVAAADDREDQLDSQTEAIDRARARADAATQPFETGGVGLIRPKTPASVAIVPGDAEDVCSLSEMIAGFEADPEAAEAFASVHGLDPGAVGAYLQTLRAGYLVDELIVINHQLRDAAAEPSASILGAGTAVLTDDSGVPRVRCECANPLLPASVELGGQLIEASAFGDRIIASAIDPEIPERVENSTDGTFTNDPGQALGPPDRVAVSLGEDADAATGACRQSITIEFIDNLLVEGPGDDLQVLELGRPESSFVYVGDELGDLVLVGEIGGRDATIDLATVAEAGDTFSLVRLCDGPDQASEVPGTDIDAVVALNSRPR